MDLMLVHPPHLIALACIYIASVLREKDTTVWYEELRVDMNVVSIPIWIKYIFSLYKILLSSLVSTKISSMFSPPFDDIGEHFHLDLVLEITKWRLYMNKKIASNKFDRKVFYEDKKEHI